MSLSHVSLVLMFVSFIVDNITFQNVALSGIQQQDQLDQQWWLVLLIDISYSRRVCVHAGTRTVHTSMLIKETSLDNFYSQIHMHVPMRAIPHLCSLSPGSLACSMDRASADVKHQSETPVEGPP